MAPIFGTVWLITTAGVLGPRAARFVLREDGPTNAHLLRFAPTAAGRCTGVRVVIPSLGIDQIAANAIAAEFGAGDTLQVPPCWLKV
jgi:hypothetical protein